MSKTSKPGRPLFDPDWLPLLKKISTRARRARRATPRQQVILAIIKGRYRKGVPAGTKIAMLHGLIEREWEAESARQKLTDPKIVKAVPGRDMIAYTLRDPSLIS
jgi:hypothetical protein